MSAKRKKNNQNDYSKFPKFIVAKTKGQQLLIDTINKNLITIVVGPPGSGKTAISVGCAIEHCYNQWTSKIIITRPVVESGPSIGFLPGTTEEKLQPYLMPLYNELENFLPEDKSSRPKVDLLPFNFMRGWTIKNTFMIADELQNASYAQIKTLLTRFGEGSKFVLTGDLEQSDLPKGQQGALEEIIKRTKDMDLVGFVELDNSDIVRHEIVGRLINKL